LYFIRLIIAHWGESQKKKAFVLTPNRNSSPPYNWATPFTRLKRETSFGSKLNDLSTKTVTTTTKTGTAKDKSKLKIPNKANSI
ncbi:hypothetical protein P4U44_15275, partial [Alkalihalobacillus alcalophilus]|uniref:hypothetical protein n=1 Tax=Alkalihalobacillus alcalophilus TaxID=1445 RepID=UPI002E1A0C5B|nr:hypothetical protein [Alkalihalobacillus alcalophilus]